MGKNKPKSKKMEARASRKGKPVSHFFVANLQLHCNMVNATNHHLGLLKMVTLNRGLDRQA